MSTEIIHRVTTLISPILLDEGLELVDLDYRRESTGWILRLYIDKEGGVTLDDCARISREAGRPLDVENPIDSPYTLEVSSPGLDRPLSRDQDFLKYRGSRVRLRLEEKIEGRRNFCAELLDYEEGGSGKILVVREGEDQPVGTE